uniref:Secreted protein n=1 Tax=Ascaris lumbricoides TaxID=6252 RepID=A0A0M3IK69_ASCLU
METAVTHMERLVVLLLVRSIAADVCIKSVFLHSATSMLPSSELFCVISENADKRAYNEAVAIATLDDFDRLVPLNHRRRFANINLEDVVSISVDGMKTAFEYPTSIFSNKCIGTAFIR